MFSWFRKEKPREKSHGAISNEVLKEVDYLLGYIAFTPSDRLNYNGLILFTHMTMKEVMECLDLIGDWGVDRPTAGKYRLGKKVLKQLINLWSPDDVFDDDLQDILAIELLTRRGLFHSRKLRSDAEVVEGIIKQWPEMEPYREGVLSAVKRIRRVTPTPR